VVDLTTALLPMMGAELSQLPTWPQATGCSRVLAGLELLTAAPVTRSDAGELAARPVNGAGLRPPEGLDHGSRAPMMRNARRRQPRAQAVAREIAGSAAAAVKCGT
jgi:hypothetical protein